MILRFGRFRWNEIPLKILWKESFQKREGERALRRDLLGSIMGHGSLALGIIAGKIF